MTEISRPWAGVTIGDAGPYTATNWWDVWGLLHHASSARSLSNLDNSGVLFRSAGRHTTWVVNTAYVIGNIVQPITENELFYICTTAGTSHATTEPDWPTTFGDTVSDGTVTWTCFGGGLDARYPSVNTVNVYVGGGLVDGTFHYSDAIEAVNIPSATAGNVRDDRIVLRKTFGAATQTVRITRLVGGEVATPGPGTPPALTQDTTRTTFWDVPLWRASVTDAGVVTLTDEREFVDAETKTLFIPAMAGWNVTDGIDVPLTYSIPRGVVIVMSDTKEIYMGARFGVPVDFLANMTSEDVIQGSGGVGTIYASKEARYGTCGESYQTHIDTGASITISIGAAPAGLQIDCVYSMQILDVNVGDFVAVYFRRRGNHASDTYGAIVYGYGFEINYLGWR
jgi:hypothetical protein